VVALLLAFGRWYGRTSPSAPYTEARDFQQAVGLDPANLPRYLLGSLLDERLGWLPFAPLHLLALCAVLLTLRRWPLIATCVTLTLIAYAVVVAASGVSPGGVLPGRYLVVVMPFVAVPLALAMQRSRAFRAAFAVGAAGTLVLLATFLRFPDSFYARPPEAPPAAGEIATLARVAAAWPDIDIRVGATAPAQVFFGVLIIVLVVLLNLLVDEASRPLPTPSVSDRGRGGVALTPKNKSARRPVRAKN
jgi:hypothetical protein